MKLRSEVSPTEFVIQRKPRLLALDLVRLLAMLMMVQGHTLDVLLNPSYQNTNWFNVWQFVRGFTAPGFMMLSGFSFALATSHGWPEHVALSSTIVRRIRRFTFFVLLGYTMHFPVHRLAELWGLDAEGWRAGLQVDVLQTIGVTLLLLQGLVFLARTPKRFAILSLIASFGVISSSAFVWAVDWSQHVPLVFASYLTGNTGSLFPMFPWSAYIFLGAGIGTLYATSNTQSQAPFAKISLVSGVALATAGFSLNNFVMRSYGRFDFWHTSPTLFITRVGVVLLGLGVAMQFTLFPRRATDLVKTLAKESLLVYSIHVCLLYGSVWNPGLRQYVGHSLDVVHAVAAAALMITFVLSLAWGWSQCKRAGKMPAYAVKAIAIVAAAWSLS